MILNPPVERILRSQATSIIRVMKWTIEMDHSSVAPLAKGVKIRMAIKPDSII